MGPVTARIRRRREPVLISAHRFGAGPDRDLENSLDALERSLRLGVDYVEFDVQRCNDGAFVVAHDSWVAVGDHHLPVASLTPPQLEVLAGTVVHYEDVLARIKGRSKAHLDLKFTSPDAAYDHPATTYEVAAVRLALDVLGADFLLVTTGEDRAVRAVRDWADEHGHELLVGLSLGRSVRGMPWPQKVRVRLSELLPRLRYRESRANLVVAKHTLARLGVAAFARRRRLPLLVWTVDSEESLRYWLRPGRAWLVTTNQPGLALEVRSGVRE
jgi:glycerophosphoryl diester phosphodiesterase